jgi:2,5-diketo-D-gluconate reductase B
MPATDLPAPGLGTMYNTAPEECAETIVRAAEIGYRHVDTAQKYENEAFVGDGIARADLPREDLFVATKIHEENLAYEDVHRTAAESLDRLGLEHVDLLYVHWPAASSHEDRYDPAETLRAFDELVEQGATRHVGIANFSVDLLEEAHDHLDVPIFAHQIEMHPLLQQAELLEYAREHDHHLVAYCPLMQGAIGEVPELLEIAEKHDATPAQVSLAWLLGKGVVPIPKATGAHLAENYRALDLALDPEDVERIDAIDREERLIDPEKGPWNW